MSVKIKDRFAVDEVKNFDLSSIECQIENLLPGEYSVFICDSKRNRTLGQTQYLFGVVLKLICDETGVEDMDTPDLYRIFEKMFAPKKVVEFEGGEHVVQDMKRCNSKEMGLIIEKIIQYADTELGIKIPTRDEVREPMAQDIYINAYNSTWQKKS